MAANSKRRAPQRLRILVAIPQYAPIMGGAERQAQAQAQGLAMRGHEVRVLTQPVRGAPTEENIRGVRVIRRLRALPLGPLFGLTYMWSAWREIRRLSPWADVIHCHRLYFQALMAARLRARGGPPVVCKALMAGPRGDLDSLGKRRFGATWVRWARGLDRIVAICDAIEQDFLDARFPPEQIARIPNLVNTEKFHPDSNAPEGDHWLVLGRLQSEKGVDVLLRALALQKKERGATSFDSPITSVLPSTVMIVGNGPDESRLASLSRRLKLKKRVRFRGATVNPYPLYREARGVILPSRGEGLPNVVLEALACGKPVIASDVGGTREILGGDGPTGPIDESHGFVWARHGILVRPEDPEALRAALEEAEMAPERLAQCGRDGSVFVKSRYSRDAVLDKLEALYQDLLSR